MSAPAPSRLSIIVPTLDEAGAIGATLEALQPMRADGHEVLVVDGGSTDGTRAIAAPLADAVLVAPRGRASQQNAGAAAAHGDVLLFLHADTRLPPGAADAVLDGMHTSGRSWGRFDVRIAGRSRLLPVVGALMNLRSRFTGIATGDQGIFVSRKVFDAAGGFPDQPLMEDIELSQRLIRVAGWPLDLRARVTTSGRRWDAHGAWRTIALMWRLRFEYSRGADPALLARRYAAMRSHAKPSLPPTLLIFARAPVAGRVKTRLARIEGEARAAEVYARLVRRTLETAAAARAAGVVGRLELWCTPDAGDPAVAAWCEAFALEFRLQRGPDLGARMRAALEATLARGEAALLIGTDCPALDVDYLRRAAAALADHDAVFGPAEDGGYVLAGLARPLDVFGDIAWSTPGVMAATRASLMAARATWLELPPLWDVDTPADLKRWEAAEGSSSSMHSADRDRG